MDIDRLRYQRVAKSGSNEEAVAFTQAAGARSSAFEHLIPEHDYRK